MSFDFSTLLGNTGGRTGRRRAEVYNLMPTSRDQLIWTIEKSFRYYKCIVQKYWKIARSVNIVNISREQKLLTKILGEWGLHKRMWNRQWMCLLSLVRNPSFDTACTLNLCLLFERLRNLQHGMSDHCDGSHQEISTVTHFTKIEQFTSMRKILESTPKVETEQQRWLLCTPLADSAKFAPDVIGSSKQVAFFPTSNIWLAFNIRF